MERFSTVFVADSRFIKNLEEKTNIKGCESGNAPTKMLFPISGIAVVAIANEFPNSPGLTLSWAEWDVAQQHVSNEEFIERCKKLFPKKKTVKIEIEVEVSDDAGWVAVDESGELYEYTNKPCSGGHGFYGASCTAVRVTNWKETLTKVED